MTTFAATQTANVVCWGREADVVRLELLAMRRADREVVSSRQGEDRATAMRRGATLTLRAS